MAFCSFYDAWKYLTENEMFFDDYGQFCVDDCFRITVEKNETNKSNKKIKLLLCADHLVLLDIQQKFGDNDGTVVGSGFTFKEAIIDLAKNVYYKYDFNENEEDDFYDDDYAECNNNCDGCNGCDNGYNNNNDNDDDYYEDDCDGNCNDCDGCDDYDYYLDNLSNQNYSDKDGLNKNLEKFYKNNLNKKLRVLKGIIDLLIEE